MAVLAAGIVLAVFLLPRTADVLQTIAGGSRQGVRNAGGTVPADEVAVLASGHADPILLAGLHEMYGKDPRAEDILSHPDHYPDDLLLLLQKRPETLDFVRDYPEKKNQKVTVDIRDELTGGEIPVFYQWDERWGYDRYGDNIVGLAGCGPTCLSMVAAGLLGDASLHPGAVAVFSVENGYRTESGTSWDLMTLGAEKLGLTGEVLSLDENRMAQALAEGRPIICSMRPGDFTDTGYFIVLVGYENGEFQIHDPNSVENTAMRWSYDRIKGQIKNLWAFST